MRLRLDPKWSVLPPGQRELWPNLAPAPRSEFVLYGGTAIALQLGHRGSLDFGFFRSGPLDKDHIRSAFGFARSSPILQDTPDTLVLLVDTPVSPVKVSFFGGIGFGRISEPLETSDGVLLVA